MNKGSFALALALTVGTVTTALADNIRVVLKGYDPVAYFTVGKPTKGDPKFVYDWDEGRYYFASAEHRAMFVKEPDRFAPQFGGYCTGSMSRGVRNEGDPEGWIINDGRLYVFGSSKFSDTAKSDPNYLPSKLPAANQNWKRKAL